jgi:hypothetical protein
MIISKTQMDLISVDGDMLMRMPAADELQAQL